MLHLHALVSALIATLRDMLPILLTIAVFHALVLGVVPQNPAGLLAGFLAVLASQTPMLVFLAAAFVLVEGG